MNKLNDIMKRNFRKHML